MHRLLGAFCLYERDCWKGIVEVKKTTLATTATIANQGPGTHLGRPVFGVMGIIVAIGIVYGDIGTSPLYVMKAVLNALPQNHPELIIGAVSCVIWTLTLQTTIKYVIITLRADNRGEGGVLSLFALVRKKYRWTYIIAAIGAATLLADGVITPSITVTSAIEGLNNVYHQVPIVPVVLCIIAGLFLAQPFGTQSLGRFFGAIMLLWFLMLGLLGLANFVEYLPIVKAFNPLYALRFIISSPNVLFILGAIFLCTTGAGALYSDLGHCGLRNIRVSWAFVKTTLVLNYLGQGAWAITHPQAAVIPDINPFFEIMPQWFFLVGVAMATIAAIIASQSMISGSFTEITEAISLDLWPNIKIKYPTNIKGQVYVPGVNFLMMAACVAVILLFRSSSNMEAAYGLSITITMLMTTMLLFFYLRMKRMAWWKVYLPMLTFLVVESGFLVANSVKFAHGGFMTILIAGFVFIVMYFWYNGRRIKNRAVSYEKIAPVIPVIEAMGKDDQIPKYATHLIYVTRAKYKTDIESKIVHSLISHPKRADTYWFVYMQRSDSPYEFSYNVTTFVPEKIFRLDVVAGFKQGIHIDDYIKRIAGEMERKGEVDLQSRYPSLRSHGIKGDFRFVVVERVLRNSSFSLRRKVTMAIYALIKRFTTSDARVLDLDPTSVTVETAPMVRS